MRDLLVALVLLVPSIAAAENRVVLGYLATPPISASGSGQSHALAARWDRTFAPWLELGAGIELGISGGDERLTRFAMLPGVALLKPLGTMTLRLEEQIGWQIVHGGLTLDAIPLRGTETRSIHQELTVALDAPLRATLSLRGRAGFVWDGIYPAGHVSNRVGLCVGLALVIAP